MAIHPTQFASERISGRLKLVKQGNALSMVISSPLCFYWSEISNISVKIFGYWIDDHCRTIWSVVIRFRAMRFYCFAWNNSSIGMVERSIFLILPVGLI